MNKVKKISNISYSIVFILLVIVLGAISLLKLARFYVSDVVDYNEWTVDLGSKFETDEASAFCGKFQFVNLNGEMRKLLGQREMNLVYKLNNGHLVTIQDKMTDEEIKRYSEEVIKYVNYCKSLDKTVLFVQPILKIDENNKELPCGLEDYSNENIDKFLGYLKSANVNVLDIRECMKEDGMDMYDYTYVTDHHWTTEGAFYAFTQITDWIGENEGVCVNLEVKDINNYEIEKYNQWHLGSYGQRTGAYYAGIDDYDLLIPKYEVSFLDSEGCLHSFRDEVVNEQVFENRNPANRYTYDYAMICPTDVASTAKDYSVLMVSDSYSKAMAPYLKLAYSDYYYQYYAEGFDSSYVTEIDPDIVIMMPYNTSVFFDGSVFISQ